MPFICHYTGKEITAIEGDDADGFHDPRWDIYVHNDAHAEWLSLTGEGFDDDDPDPEEGTD